MKYLQFLILLLMLPFNGKSQAFTNVFGGDQVDGGEAICITNDQGIVVAGFTRSFMAEGVDIYVVKFNSAGDTIWSTYIGRDTTFLEGFHSEKSVGVLENSEHEIIVCGTLNIVGESDNHTTLLHRLSADGELLQSKASGSIGAEDIVEMENGGYLICGYAYLGFALAQAAIMRVDADFNVLWVERYAGSYEEQTGLKGICKLSANEFVVGGYTQTPGPVTGLMSAVDTLGNVLWSYEFETGASLDIIVQSVARLNSHTIVCAGRSGYNGISRYPTIWAIDTAGMGQWIYQGNGGPGRSELYDIIVTEDGDIAACGIYDSTESWTDPNGLFMLLDEDGELLKEKIMHDSEGFFFNSMVQDGINFYLTGSRNEDALLVKNRFYNPDTLCGLENLEPGFLDPTPTPYASYHPIPFYGGSDETYIVRTGSGAEITEVCSHEEIFDLGVNLADGQTETVVYPNPTSGLLTIQSPTVVLSITLFNMNGQRIDYRYLNAFNPTFTLPSSCGEGLYLLKIETEEQTIYEKIMLK